MKEESYQQKVFKVIQSLTGEKNLLTTPRELIKFVGDLHAGIFLGQLIYWTDKGTREDGFIYKSSKEWQEEIYLSDYSIRKARKILVDMGILEVKVKKANGNPTVHYKLDREAFINRLFEFQQKGENQLFKKQQKENKKTTKGNFKNNKSLTDTTTETTTNITSSSKEEENPIITLFKEIKGDINVIEKINLNKLIEQHPEELVVKAIEVAAVKAEHFNLDYVKSCLKDWEGQTVAEVEKALSKASYSSKKGIEKQQSTFNNFKQRDYDFDKLKKQLLGWEE